MFLNELDGLIEFVGIFEGVELRNKEKWTLLIFYLVSKMVKNGEIDFILFLCYFVREKSRESLVWEKY